MKTAYKISNSGLQKSDVNDSFLAIYYNPNKDERKKFITKYNLTTYLIDFDDLNSQTISSTSRQALIDVSNTERNLVILQHTLSNQEETLTKLLENKEFIEASNNPHLVHDVKWYKSQVKKIINVYRDLLDSLSSLFSDIMSNNLNKLMKFLISLSLILAASSLIGDL